MQKKHTLISCIGKERGNVNSANILWFFLSRPLLTWWTTGNQVPFGAIGARRTCAPLCSSLREEDDSSAASAAVLRRVRASYQKGPRSGWGQSAVKQEFHLGGESSWENSRTDLYLNDENYRSSFVLNFGQLPTIGLLRNLPLLKWNIQYAENLIFKNAYSGFSLKKNEKMIALSLSTINSWAKIVMQEQ